MNLPRWFAIALIAGRSFTPAAAATKAANHDASGLPTELELRLRLAHQLGREANDRKLVTRIETAAQAVKEKIAANHVDAAEKLVRETEAAVGIDPGGWAVDGQKIFHPSPALMTASEAVKPIFEAALAADDADAVRRAVAKWRDALGDQAGLPDTRRRGRRAKIQRTSEKEAVEIFLKALAHESKAIREISAGRTVGNNMLRFYASVVSAVCDIRPAVERHQPRQLPALDRLISGACAILTRLQQPAGHFPFPDLRGENIRFGEMTEKLLAQGKGEVKNGWIVSVDPTGGSQFDTGVCGTALLQAGQALTNSAWIKAGLRAADWSRTQKCCPNFNYNAFSVTLLARAFRASNDAVYLDAAIKKFRVGVAPGQVANGRWIDPHNARTVYHHIILRGLNDLAEALPAERVAEIAEVEAVANPAMRALLEEWAASGVTVDLLAELLRHEARQPGDARLRGAIELSASVIREKSTSGLSHRFGAPPTELAALARVWK